MKASAPWMIKKTTSIVISKGIALKRVMRPKTNRDEQKTSAKTASASEKLLPKPIGSGNTVALFEKFKSFGIPWAISIERPMATRKNSNERSIFFLKISPR